MKNIFDAKFLLAAVAVASCIAAPVSAEAQRGYGGNDRYNNQWDYRYQNQNRWNPGRRQWRPVNIRGLADRAERLSNSLRGSFERDYDRYDLDRYNRYDDAKRKVQKMDENMEDFRRAVDDRRPWSGRDELARAIRYARDVQSIFNRYPRINSNVRSRWNEFRRDLNELAEVYDVQRL